MKEHKTNGRLKLKVVLESLTEQVDDAFIISSKEPDGVFEKEHEGCIDDSISQLVGIDLRGSIQPTHLSHSIFTVILLTQKKTTVMQLDISLGTIWTTRTAIFSLCKLQEASPLTHIEIKERIHLVLNDGDRLEQLLCIHGPHHAIHSARTGGAEDREDGEKMEKQR